MEGNYAASGRYYKGKIARDSALNGTFDITTMMATKSTPSVKLTFEVWRRLVQHQPSRGGRTIGGGHEGGSPVPRQNRYYPGRIRRCPLATAPTTSTTTMARRKWALQRS